MNNNLTEIVFILDRSGSMSRLTNDTIGGFNGFIEKQKQESGEAVLTTILFDDKYEVLHDGINIKEIPTLTGKEYFVRGSTAYLDAIGKTINTIGNKLNNMSEEERPGQVIFVITTDGQENASKEFSCEQIKQMVEHQTNVYNWQFIFLGANIDAVTEASKLGIRFSANYSASSVGVDSVYSTVANTVSEYRNSGMINDEWNSEIK